ncbi:MAG: pseudaminic acid synthase [Brevundimonas sp.]|nr:MAG: pseudaminic acid synthase [Brevundimonas sp.]
MTFEIAGRKIGAAHEPFIICELSGNHNGSLERALTMVDAAAATGCDAIKIQTYTPDTMTIESERSDFRIEGGPWDGRTLYDLYGEAHTPYEWHAALFERARQHGVIMFSSPFDTTAVDLLEELDAPAYKIASFEIVDLALIAYVARRGKPMIISTGLANLEEIERAVATVRENGNPPVVLLHCISAYPAPMNEANVRTVADIATRFGVVSGLSDHTMGSAASVTAISLGAAVVEKHFTLARADGGPDSGFSLEPDEFAALVRDCKDAWRALGAPGYQLKGSEEGNIAFRRSLYVVADVEEGAPFTDANVRSIRPGYGLEPRHLESVLGKSAARRLERGEALRWDMLA